jgi:hypothetical protein
MNRTCPSPCRTTVRPSRTTAQVIDLAFILLECLPFCHALLQAPSNRPPTPDEFAAPSSCSRPGAIASTEPESVVRETGTANCRRPEFMVNCRRFPNFLD